MAIALSVTGLVKTFGRTKTLDALDLEVRTCPAVRPSTYVEFGVRALTSTPPTLEELFLRHDGAAPATGQLPDSA